MNINFHDPAISISIGVILIGFAFLIWAIGKLRQKTPSEDTTDFLGSEPVAPSRAEEFFGVNQLAHLESSRPSELEFKPPPVTSASHPVRSDPPSPVVNKEMLERLDSMSSRLSEMQTVLQRQASHPAGMGTPLTAETIDKLLKIIGSVTQQVDVLQRSLGTTPTVSVVPTATAAPKAIETISAATAVANPPPPASKPVGGSPTGAPPVGVKPGTKGIGVGGGVLSSTPRPTPPATKPASGPGSPPPANPTTPGK